MKLSTKFTFEWDKNALSRAFAWVWLQFKPPKERREALRNREMSIELISAGNLAVLLLIFGWAGLYFSYQYNFVETPRYYTGPLFAIGPTLFLQQFRFDALDFFCTYFYVYGLGLLYLFFWGVSFASEKTMWKLALCFLACWIMQGTLQLALGAASPIRIPGNGAHFIRYEVFPMSEAMIGIKYGAIPSGHIGAPIILYLTGKVKNIKWIQWLAIVYFALFWFIVLYLGEHFVFDGLVSMVLYPTLFLGTWKLGGYLEKWQAKRKEVIANGQR